MKILKERQILQTHSSKVVEMIFDAVAHTFDRTTYTFRNLKYFVKNVI